MALRQLGWVAALEQDWATARDQLERSRDLYREIGDRGGLAAALTGLGQVALGQADQALARQRFAEALRLTTEARLVPYTLATLVGVAQLLMESGQPRRGVQLLAATLQHPASDRETRERAQHLLDQGRRQLGPSAFEEAGQPGSSPLTDFDNTVARLQVELAAPTDALAPKPATAASLLTGREQEILGLIAAGLSNPEIAQRLVMSVGTIKWYTSQIYGKLSVRGRTQAIARGRQLGLLP